MRRPLPTLCCLGFGLLFAGCASQLKTADSLFGLVTPYRIEIVQGNVVTKEQLSLLQTGMSRRQVSDVLGSPLVADLFHADRWDYLFTIRRQGAEPQRRNVTVLFQDDKLAKVDAQELPSELEFVASISPARDIPKRKLELSEEERTALPLPPPREAPPVEPTGPLRTYPPLEGS